MADRFADKVAVDDGTTRLTYRAVREAVTELAARIVATTQVGAPVAAVLHTDAAFPVVFLACLMTGRPIIPVDAHDPLDRQLAILRDCGAMAVVLGEGIALPGPLPGSPPIIPAAATGAAPTADGAPMIATDTDATAGVIYTSGSTGQPKGVAFSQRQFLAGLADYVNACHIGPHDRLLGLTSLAAGSARDALAALLSGATFHIADLKQAGVGAAFQTLARAEVTVLAFVPSVMRTLARLPGAAAALASLRVLDLVGEPVTTDAVAAIRAALPPTCHLRVSFGSTETMVLFHWFVPRDFAEAGPGVPCGYLAANMAVVLLDEDGAPVAAGAVGELVVRSRCIASGMWRHGAVQAGPFMTDQADPARRILHTGDLLRLRHDGLAEFVGRRDRRVKIRGLRADPGDVEAALHRIPGIAECAVVSGAPGGDAAFVAYVVADVTERRRTVSVAAVRDALAAELPPHLLPATIHLLDRIPRLPNFKPDLVALLRRVAAPSLA